jgi:hypothetical protein
MTDKFTSLFGIPKKNENIEKDIEEGEGEESTSMLKSIKSSVEKSVEVEISYTYFFIVFGTGLLFIILSFFHLPLIIFFPGKFSSLFSIGSIIILLSFIFIYGTCQFLGMLFKKERCVYTIIYLFSVIGGFIFSYLYNYYIVVLICTSVQLISIIIFILTFIPGGYSGISIILQMLKLPLNAFFSSNNKR